MGRQKSPITDDGPQATFALELRIFRSSKGGPTYREMAELAHVSHTALSLADRGMKLPTWTVTEAYLRGCGVADAEIDEWRARYDSTRTAIALRNSTVVRRQPDVSAPAPSATATIVVQVLPTLGQPKRGLEPERLSHMFSAVDLVAALNDLVSSQGYNLAELTRRIHDMSMPRIDAPRAWHYLTTSEVRGALTGTMLPHRNVVVGIVNACGGSAADVEAWTDIWHRLHRDEQRAQAKLNELLEQIRTASDQIPTEPRQPAREPDTQTPKDQLEAALEAIFADTDVDDDRARSPKILTLMSGLLVTGLLVAALVALPLL